MCLQAHPSPVTVNEQGADLAFPVDVPRAQQAPGGFAVYVAHVLGVHVHDAPGRELAVAIREGVFASRWIAENKAGRAAFNARRRIERELAVIEAKDFPGYFLIVSDFIKWAKDHDIPVGPGRGSGAGSLVAYSLTITDIDPLRYGLFFERFLNPERVSMPDFDIDFCQDRRDEVIRYVVRRYGEGRVAQIITFGTLLARGVMRDVGRVLGLRYGEVDRLTKLVPQNPANPITLEKAIEEEPQLRAAGEENEAVGRMLAIAQVKGQLKAQSVEKIGAMVAKNPADSVAVLRGWIHEKAPA